MLVRDVRGGGRKTQVLGSPRMPKAKGNHLLLKQGKGITPTGLAPPRGDCAGWVRAPQIWLPHYASILSSPYGTGLTKALTEPCQKLLGFSPCGVSLLLNWGNSTCNLPRIKGSRKEYSHEIYFKP